MMTLSVMQVHLVETCIPYVQRPRYNVQEVSEDALFLSDHLTLSKFI